MCCIAQGNLLWSSREKETKTRCVKVKFRIIAPLCVQTNYLYRTKNNKRICSEPSTMGLRERKSLIISNRREKKNTHTHSNNMENEVASAAERWKVVPSRVKAKHQIWCWSARTHAQTAWIYNSKNGQAVGNFALDSICLFSHSYQNGRFCLRII